MHDTRTAEIERLVSHLSENRNKYVFLYLATRHYWGQNRSNHSNVWTSQVIFQMLVKRKQFWNRLLYFWSYLACWIIVQKWAFESSGKEKQSVTSCSDRQKTNWKRPQGERDILCWEYFTEVWKSTFIKVAADCSGQCRSYEKKVLNRFVSSGFGDRRFKAKD